MLNISDGKIGIREFVALIIFAVGTKATDTTPDLLIFPGKNAAWMISLFSFLFMLVPILLLLRLIKKHNKGLADLTFMLAGKWFGTLIVLMLFAIMFSGLLISIRSYIDIVSTMYYQKTPISFLFLLLVATSCMIAKRGFETIGRMAWLMFGWIHISGVLLVIFLWDGINWGFLFPIAGPGFMDIIKNGASYSTIFFEFFLLASMFPFVRSYKEFRIASWIGFVLSAAWVTLLTMLYTLIFDYPSVEHINFPYHQLARIASVGPITHLESIFLGFWIISAAIHFAIILYLVAYLFARTLRIVEFEPLLLPFGGLALFLGMLPDNIVSLNFYREALFKFGSGVILTLPLLYWMLDIWKGRKKNNAKQTA
jgi:spore germination protein KB